MPLKFNIFDTIHRRINNNKFLPTEEGGTKHWSGSDSEELYKKNLLTQPKDWYYRHNTVTYTVNSDGFRTHEFKNIDWSNSVVIFGCSYVFGVGLDDKDTISTRLEEILNIPVINMGAGGSSIMFNLHNATILRDGYPTPKAVIMIWPGYNRLVEYNKHDCYFHGGWTLQPNNLPDVWFKNQTNVIANSMLMSKLSRILWEDKCPYYEATWDDGTKNILKCDFIKTIDNDYARDIMHPGIKSAKNFAKIIASRLKL